MRDLTLFYMRSGDKYWALFLLSIFLVFVIWPEIKKGQIKAVAGYGFLTYLLLIFPGTYEVLVKLCPQMESYYELGYIIPMVQLIAVAAVLVLLRLGKTERWRKAYIILGVVCILEIAGDCAYIPSAQQTQMYTCTKEEKQVFDMILSHARGRGDADGVCIWSMQDMMMKSAFYDEALVPVYEKDILSFPEIYSESVRSMYEGYNKYLDPENRVSMLEEYLYAVAGIPGVYEDVECDYVIVYEPQRQMERIGKSTTVDANRVREIFEEKNYEFVGMTEEKLVFYNIGK